MRNFLVALPIVTALIIGGFFYWGLDPERDPSAIPSALISQPVPDFELPAVAGSGVPGLSSDDLRSVGEPVLVNVFASWCVPCRAEHATLTRFVEQEGIRLMGINYQDKPQDAAKWLEDLGNPYERIGSDLKGRVGVEWGLSGVPETFIVDAKGIVVFRYVGPIIGPDAQSEVLSAVVEARAQS